MRGTYGHPRDVAPAEAVLAEIARTVGHVEWLAARIGASATPGDNATIAPEISKWIELYFAERKHLLQACRAAHAMSAVGPIPARDEIDEIRARREARRMRDA